MLVQTHINVQWISTNYGYVGTCVGTIILSSVLRGTWWLNVDIEVCVHEKIVFFYKKNARSAGWEWCE